MILRWIIVCVLVMGVPPRAYSTDSLLINEFMATNISTRLNPDNSDFEDWIELYNSGDSPLELGGIFLTDDFTNPFKWQFPEWMVIEPKSYFIVWADGTGIDEHASFKLSGNGEQIGLYYPDGRVIDTITFGIQRNDISCGRFPDGGKDWQYFQNPTFSNSNNVAGLSSNIQASQPNFTPEGGLFFSEQMITISSGSGTTICYTTDGSIPTPESPKYTNPISTYGTTILRARVYLDNMLPSDVVTHSYIIDEPTTLPVISIATPPEFLWDEEIGITVGICVSDELGAPPPFDPNANFWKKWERPVHIEYFTPEGDAGFKQDAGIAIFGGLFGRQIKQKAFTLYARDKYGDSDFDFPLFPTKSINSFKRFLLRCSSNDFNRTYIRDAMMNSLVIGQMDIDYQAYQPAIVYINGDFWGLYNIREKTNQFYPESNYGIDTDLVDLIEGIDITAHGDGSHYQDLIQFVMNNDMLLTENYQYIQTQMDVVEFMNYYITEIYVCNRDWLHQNIKCWREHSDNGKWRWLLYDTDWGFSGEYVLGPDQFTNNTLQWVLEEGPSSVLFQRLLMNGEFRAEFAQRFVTHLNLTFNPARVHHTISTMVEKIAPEMPKQIERWGAIQSMDYWNEQLDILYRFAQERPPHMDAYLTETLMPEEKGEFILEVSNEEAGWISVYDVPCPVPAVAGQWYRNIPLKIRAHPKPGWRFVRWEGADQSFNDSISITLTDNAFLYAVFEPFELPSIVISEIHYNPSTDLEGVDEEFEFIELVNTEESRIDISAYQFTDGIDFTFPEDSHMDAGEYIIVAANAGTYANRGIQVFQVSTGRLDNAGEKLSLSNNQGMVIDQVHYDDHYPWPRKPDGEGPSLELKDPSLDNNVASSWKESEQTGGTPGTGIIIGVEETHHNDLETKLLNIRPNPFNFITYLKYTVPEKGRLTIKIFNSFGQEVRLLTDETQKPGMHEIAWKPENLPSGIYFIHVCNDRYSQTEKVLYFNKD